MILAFNQSLFAQIPGDLVQNYRFECDDQPFRFQVIADPDEFDDLSPVFIEGLNGVSNVNFDPPSNLLTFTANVDDYPGYGHVIFEGTSNFTGDLVHFKVFIIACCQDGIVPSYDDVWIDDELSNLLPSGSLVSQNILVMGTIEVDIPIFISMSNLDFGTDASMIINPSASFHADESEFAAYCKFYWEGIEALNPSINVESMDCIYRDALKAFYISDNATVNFEENIFDNNAVSLLVENYSSGGGFGYGSYLSLNGNDFLLSVMYGSHVQHPNSIVDMSSLTGSSIFNQQTGYGVKAINCDYLEIGHNGNLMNNFHAVLSEITHFGCINTSVRVENNEFTNAKGIKAEYSSLKIGDLSQGGAADNIFNECELSTDFSSVTLEKNQINSADVHLVNGVHAIPPGSSHAGIHVEENEISSIVGINFNISNTQTSVTKYRVLNNNFFDASLQCANLQINGINKLFIDDNTFTITTAATNNTLLKLNNVDGGAVYENVFSARTGSNPLDGGSAIILESTVNTEIHSNSIETLNNNEHSFARAFKIINDNSNSSYVCNDIYQAYYAFELVNATLSDFGNINQITLNKFLEDGASFQNSFYGTLNNIFDVDYYHDAASGSMGSFTYSHDPFFGINPPDITGGGGGDIANQSGFDNGCSPAPLPRIASNVLHDEEKQEKWNIYPNPSSSQVFVDLENINHAEFRIVNVLGQTLWSGTLYDQDPIPVNLSSGTYIIERVYDGNQETKRLIVQ